MKKASLKAAMGLVAALAAGGAMAQDTAQEAPDRFDNGFSGTQTMSACTSDQYTASANISAFPSVTDWQREMASDQAKVDNYIETLNETLKATWNEVVAKYSASDLIAGSEDFVKDINDGFKKASNEIESKTGITTMLRGSPAGIPTPGCK